MPPEHVVRRVLELVESGLQGGSGIDRRAELHERLWALVTEWADEVRELPDGRVELTFDPGRR